VELSLRDDLSASSAVTSARQQFSAAKCSVDSRATLWVIGAALIALFLKLAIAYNTIGTNDAVSFYVFARSLHNHGLQWTYLRGAEWLPVSPIFNHPPLTAYYLELIATLARTHLFQSCGFSFPFLLRFPGIIADFIVVLVLLNLSRRDARYRMPTWALMLFAYSPVSLMVSGFHGNTDSVMVMFLVLATVACLKSRPLLCGLFLALSCQVKVIALLFLPIFFFVWLPRREVVRFLIPFAVTSVLLCLEPLSRFPVLFVKNVLFYGSFWGGWGITYWLRLTGLPTFGRVSFMNLSAAQTIVAAILKSLIVVAVFVIAWRRRTLDVPAVATSIGYAWVIFFALSPGGCPQYMVWLAPFALFLSPTFYVWLTAASSLFLFFFYNITAQGLPWFLAVSRNHGNEACSVWALWPWIAIVFGAIMLWKSATALDPSLRLFSIQPLIPRPSVNPDAAN
jgi:glycosyl transferase family 87